MKGHKKTVAVCAIMAGLFLVCAIKGSAAALPSWMPAESELAGYTLVWDNTLSVQWFIDEDSNGNVTCSSQVWLKNGTSGLVDANVIGASMIDKGGDVLSKGVDLSKGDIGTQAARGLLSAAGLNTTQIDAIRSVWDIVVEVLRVNQGSSYVLTEPSVPNVDNAVMLEFSAAGDYQYVLFCTRQDHCMVVYSFNASQDWIDWLNATGTGSLILAKMQLVTWGFWVVLAAYVAVIVSLANFLGVSGAPAVVAESATPALPAAPVASSGGIHASAFTPTSDMTAFASAWGALFPDFPWWIVIVVAVGAVAGIVIIVAVVRRRRNK
ncbi:MAG: hypothetical protein JW839_23155 [Candidatus Lokiarchaeota archaeon]|nr:hypothetical protein [Candidatus Lokiarchaeota archaeon]